MSRIRATMFNIDNLNLKNIFESTSDGIFLLDKEWRIVAMNRAAEFISGWNRSEVGFMRLCTELFLCFDRDGNQLCESSCPKEGAISGNNPSGQLEVKVMTKSGQALILSGSCVPVPSGGDFSYAAVMIKDEIEKQLLEEKLLAGERLDPLTQLYHRQYFEELYNIEAKRAQRHGGTVTLLMLDVERLREVNSKLGNKAGDAVLKGIGKVIKKTIREVDVAGRYGEDEYILLLYGVDEVKARIFIERLRDNIKKWGQTEKLPSEVRLNTCLMVSDKDFGSLLERMKGIIDKHEGVPL